METQHSERFSFIIENLSRNPSDFSRMIGKSPQTVASILGGRNKAGADVLEATLLAYPQINSDWLILGKGEPFRKNEEPESENLSSMWKTLKGNYESRIDELLYTINLQKQIINGDLGKPEPEERTQGGIYKFYPHLRVVRVGR